MMRGRRLWVFVLVVGIMTLSTVCYVTMLRNAKTSYANGRFVEQEGPENEVKCYLLKIGAR